jgi:peptidoglycan/xylan/chitin deacetylase (PgdA/CDA1 family)
MPHPNPNETKALGGAVDAATRRIHLTFHGVGEKTRQLDSGEADVWVSADRFTGVLDAVARRPDVQISFDDGNASDVEIALPALRERGLSATFFVVAGRVGTDGFLDADDIGTLANEGMTIGCHGMHHRRWRRLSPGDLHQELVVSRDRLEEIVGRPVTHAACPFGSYDRQVLRSLRSSGYDRVFTSDCGPSRPDRWLQPRNSVRSSHSALALDELLTPEVPAHRAVYREAKLAVKRWR